LAPAPAPKVTAEATPSANYASAGALPTADGGAAGPAFRWPLRGRVISGFPKNDGIDLAVPEGTAVHAAEDGVVAYAGNELKGYGNLILIRHSNGYVTAYAHASELMVKRNDSVRRGQVIAKSGQSGSVSAPQLHFEIRKGSTPVDPMQFLPSS
jgi:murein DD-endopeptidase MepM/ murein hydrolase activator NlpD